MRTPSRRAPCISLAKRRTRNHAFLFGDAFGGITSPRTALKASRTFSECFSNWKPNCNLQWVDLELVPDRLCRNPFLCQKAVSYWVVIKWPVFDLLALERVMKIDDENEPVWEQSTFKFFVSRLSSSSDLMIRTGSWSPGSHRPVFGVRNVRLIKSFLSCQQASQPQVRRGTPAGNVSSLIHFLRPTLCFKKRCLWCEYSESESVRLRSLWLLRWN